MKNYQHTNMFANLPHEIPTHYIKTHYDFYYEPVPNLSANLPKTKIGGTSRRHNQSTVTELHKKKICQVQVSDM